MRDNPETTPAMPTIRFLLPLEGSSPNRFIHFIWTKSQRTVSQQLRISCRKHKDSLKKALVLFPVLSLLLSKSTAGAMLNVWESKKLVDHSFYLQRLQFPKVVFICRLLEFPGNQELNMTKL